MAAGQAVRCRAGGTLLCSALYYLGDYPLGFGLERKFGLKKKILKWVGFNFVSDSSQN